MSTSRRERTQDACPGVLRTHPAADGALARLRLPGGRLAPRAARELAACARELGDGHLELTSRGNVQIRGLADGAAVALAGRARAVGLLPSDTHERIRNIVASPLSGRGPGGRDVRGLVAALDEGLRADPVLAALPGRVLFAVDDGSGDLEGIPADLALRAQPGGRTLVCVAGETLALRVPDLVAVPALLAAARAFVDRVAAGGPAASAWRVAELPDGRDQLLAAAAGVAATAGALVADDRPVTPGTSIPGMSTGRSKRPASPGAQPGAHAQRDGRWALTALVPLGRLRADQLDLVAGIAERLEDASVGGDQGTAGAGALVVTPWRSVVLLDLTAAQLADVRTRLAAAGLVVEEDSGWLGVTSCAGRPGCARALADVRRDATRVALAAGAGARRPALPVHWSGCGRRCGQPSGAVAEVVAQPDGYHVRAGSLASSAPFVVTWAPDAPVPVGAAGDGDREPGVVDWSALVDAVTEARELHRRETG
ncbi:precorrin-3B synthase [Frankia sp. AgPm24]|uniref:precorrin-3B synthase n=1 Tax=Frankia sp. AgPm24 TaxID=631128 RepID=UPI002010AFAF|nr:precorrin-3B synthase [Frankia sp. AgPm24]MCK9924425.1 precorrin-3B synthase [Frankia sp. AgPm24]